MQGFTGDWEMRDEGMERRVSGKKRQALTNDLRRA